MNSNTNPHGNEDITFEALFEGALTGELRVQPPRDVIPQEIHTEEFEELVRLIDFLYEQNAGKAITKIELLTYADMYDLCTDLQEVIDLLPSGSYTRARLTDQLNSILTAHGWGRTYGTLS